MQIQVLKNEGPIEPTADRKGRASHKITTTNNIIFYARKDVGQKIEQDTLYEVTSSPDKHNNKWINEVTPIKDINEDLNKIKETFSNSSIDKVYEGGEPVNNKPTMTPKDFLIVLQSCVNRQADWTPTQKLKFILDNYFNGVAATHKDLDDGSSY